MVKTREIVYGIFYGVFILLCVFSGQLFGYKSSHTPPLPFVAELLVLPIGFLLLLIDVTKHRPVQVHAWGLGANALIFAIVVLQAL